MSAVGEQTLPSDVAARTKLRKLMKEQAAKEAAAASKPLAERSPHAKEVNPPCQQRSRCTF